jgi:aldehyde dehydrogenase (NAD+)
VSHNFIAGRWVRGEGPAIIDIDPATNTPLAHLTAASLAQVDEAVTAARRVAPQWRRFPAPRRAEILFAAAEVMTRQKEELARDVSREMGKVIEEGRGDVQEAIDLAYFYGGEGRRLLGMTTPSESRHKLAYAVRAVQLPVRDPRAQGVARAHRGQHGRAQAVERDSARRESLRADHGRSRAARRRP